MDTDSSRRAVDSATLRRWAAEHIAVELGVLRECPYHGEPYRPHDARPVPPGYCAYATHDPLVFAFGGDAGELLTEVDRVASECEATCPACRREHAE